MKGILRAHCCFAIPSLVSSHLPDTGASGLSSGKSSFTNLAFLGTRSHSLCKTLNSGLRSKEEKPCDPINQSSRCNTQEGLLSFVQTGDSDLLGGRAHRTANWTSFICSMLHTGYKVIGYMFAKQSYWYKLRGLLFKFKAILLVQTARAFSKLRRPRAFYWVHIDWPAPGYPMGAGNPTISRETET